MYSMLLNAKGRAMFDILLYHLTDDEVLVECDRFHAEKVRKHLSMYRIRRKVTVSHLPDEPIGHVFNPQSADSINPLEHHGTDGYFCDPRVLSFGQRVVGTVPERVETISLDQYHRARFELGLAEGHQEIQFDKSFPLESNLGKGDLELFTSIDVPNFSRIHERRVVP